MKKIILALTVLLTSSSSFAVVMTDVMYPTMKCITSGMADGGYHVDISAGGVAPHTEASLMEDTIRGGVLVDHFVVGASKNRTQDTVLADLYTQGQSFQLVVLVHGQPMGGAPVPAVLRANTKAGRLNLKLVCSRLNQSH